MPQHSWRLSGFLGSVTDVSCAWVVIVVMLAAFCLASSSHAESAKGESPEKGTVSDSDDVANPQIKNVPLHEAAADGDHEQAKKLLESHNVNSEDVLGSTPLMYAAKEGELDICKLLIENKADVNVQNHDGMTALMYASVAGYLPVVEFLVEKGADLNAIDKSGKNALTYAQVEGRDQVEQFLTSKGAKEPLDLGTMRGSYRDWRHCRGRRCGRLDCWREPRCIWWGRYSGRCREWRYVRVCTRGRRHHRAHWR